MESLHIYSDGGSQNNPGSSAIAFLIFDNKNNVLKEYKTSIGYSTNNQAEYRALIRALEIATSFSRGDIVFYSDSELMIKQLNGYYKIKNPIIQNLFLKVKEREKMFRKIIYCHIPRENENIMKVDKLVKECLKNKNIS